MISYRLLLDQHLVDPSLRRLPSPARERHARGSAAAGMPEREQAPLSPRSRLLSAVTRWLAPVAAPSRDRRLTFGGPRCGLEAAWGADPRPPSAAQSIPKATEQRCSWRAPHLDALARTVAAVRVELGVSRSLDAPINGACGHP